MNRVNRGKPVILANIPVMETGGLRGPGRYHYLARVGAGKYRRSVGYFSNEYPPVALRRLSFFAIKKPGIRQCRASFVDFFYKLYLFIDTRLRNVLLRILKKENQILLYYPLVSYISWNKTFYTSRQFASRSRKRKAQGMKP